MKTIPLTQNKVALVDDEDFEMLNRFKWHFRRDGYAARNVRLANGKRQTVRMHRMLIEVPNNAVTDHRDRNRLNNQKANLRVCTRGQNGMNKGKYVEGTSIFKGVSIYTTADKKYRYYMAQIRLNGKCVSKRFPLTRDGEIQAAKAYNAMAMQHFGAFALLNNVS